MALTDAEKANFDTLLRAAADGNLALMSCKSKLDGSDLAIICCVNHNPDGSYGMVPVAAMLQGNPQDYLEPPAEASNDVPPIVQSADPTKVH